MADKKDSYKLVIYPVEKLEVATSKLVKDAKSVRDRLHSLATSTFYHWFKGTITGEQAATYMNAIVQASPYHRKAVAKWVNELTPFQWSEEKGEFFAHKNQKIKESVFLKAKTTPFWEVSPPPEAKPLDLWEEIDRIIDKAQKHVEKPVEGDVVDMKVMRGLRDLQKLRKAS